MAISVLKIIIVGMTKMDEVDNIEMADKLRYETVMQRTEEN